MSRHLQHVASPMTAPAPCHETILMWQVGSNTLTPTTQLSIVFSGSMVSAMFALKVFVAFAPLTNVWARYTNKTALPLLLDATGEELTMGLETGAFTSVDLVQAYVARILEMNVTLHMVTEINPDAWDIAKTLDEERASGKIRGPLHGLPILIKNNIATADEMNNTAGSFSLLGARVPRDSTIAAKLRAAGAIILGKTNLSQWANYRSSNSSNGWSAYGGQTYGAYYPGQDPSGSSSGSGVSASLGLAFAALGTETDGSIISPAQVNNVVGVKPTVGLTSRTLVIPISEHQDSVGPMARTVKDAAYILQAIAGPDPADNYTLAIPWASNSSNATVPDYVAACTLDALMGKRIGIPRNAIGTRSASTAAIFDAFEASLAVLRSAGAVIVENTNYTAYAQYLNSTAEDIVLSADFKPNLAAYLAQLTYNPNNVTSLADVRAFTQRFPMEDYPDRDTAEFDASLALNFSNTDIQFWNAYQQDLYLGGEGGLLGALATYDLDAVVVPSRVSSGISAIIGGPVVTVPMGAYPANTTVRTNSRMDLNATAPNIPFGLSFAGKLWSEESLIGFAYAFEQRTNVREKVKPYVQPSLEISDFL
ncbi:amidase signature enzyme [Dothidotthia symphoricarpi CBS 119687]|uniref:Amidase signature enzyme n=1 Tax=Dothidotthia symphoricarpi CBS 119687 TaxID=1392245 RepID=A0A6A6A023_9PLEO|nr:amidase signature enzyme [Dothidotthia symphoricarpi CBS 119687]KAF2124038.1 amidase signature enzyme [Dothidotthia symphoricarpi CBS 119687]